MSSALNTSPPSAPLVISSRICAAVASSCIGGARASRGRRARAARGGRRARQRLTEDLPERAAEGSPAGEADVEADVGDAAVGLAQQEHRALHSPPLQVTVRRFPEDGSEAADEVCL